jgi:hypothetical protein
MYAPNSSCIGVRPGTCTAQVRVQVQVLYCTGPGPGPGPGLGPSPGTSGVLYLRTLLRTPSSRTVRKARGLRLLPPFTRSIIRSTMLGSAFFHRTVLASPSPSSSIRPFIHRHGRTYDKRVGRIARRMKDKSRLETSNPSSGYNDAQSGHRLVYGHGMYMHMYGTYRTNGKFMSNHVWYAPNYVVSR